MNSMFYSKSTGGFYSLDIHGIDVPSDAVAISSEQHDELMAGQAAGLRIVADSNGSPVLAEQPPPTLEQVEAMFVSAIQQRLDSFARTRNYDGILSACTYASSTVARFQAEGQFAVALRDQTWAAAYDLLMQVQAGTRPMPEGISDIEPDLPALEWPV